MKVIQRILRFAGIAIAAFLLLTILWFLSALLLSKIKLEGDKTDAAGITIFLLSNGVHTDIVMPVINEHYDWTKYFKFENTREKESGFSYVAVGWGDRDFYLNTPEWSDLKLSVAFNAAFGLGKAALHTSFYKHMTSSRYCAGISISKDQYLLLTAYIEDYIEKDENGESINIQPEITYGSNNAFYEAAGKLSLFKSCNTWTNNALKSSGLPSLAWTVFSAPLMRLYSKQLYCQP